jgi:hypothetical protein
MARPLRIEYDGALYHVRSRGNERKAIFRDDADRMGFPDTLQRVNERFNWICHAYCLMNNHYQLIIETPDGNLSQGMRQLNGEGAFFEKLLVHVQANEDIREIPKRQRYVSRPALSEILADSKQLAKQIRKAVLDYGCSQRETAQFMGIHYSTISRRVNYTCHAINKT